MSTIICKQIEVVKLSDVLSISGVNITTNGEELISTIQSLSIKYNKTIEHPDAGPIVSETVVVEAYSKDISPVDNGDEMYILRLHTNSSSFIVGTLQFPSTKSISDNKMRATITFKAKKPI